MHKTETQVVSTILRSKAIIYNKKVGGADLEASQLNNNLHVSYKLNHLTKNYTVNTAVRWLIGHLKNQPSVHKLHLTD